MKSTSGPRHKDRCGLWQGLTQLWESIIQSWNAGFALNERTYSYIREQEIAKNSANGHHCPSIANFTGSTPVAKLYSSFPVLSKA
jgi:hypothetical protein